MLIEFTRGKKVSLIDLRLAVRNDMTVQEAHNLCEAIEQEIRPILISNAGATIRMESESACQTHEASE